MPNAGDNNIDVPAGALGLQGHPPAGFLVHQRGSLVATTRLLEQQARTCLNEGERHWYTIATTVCAHAAVEAILNEWAHRRDAATYAAVLSRGTVARAAYPLVMIPGSHTPVDLADLSYFKNALCHAEPDNQRSGEVGNWTTSDGAQRSLAVVLDLQDQLFPPA